jgi:hypothetical protein
VPGILRRDHTEFGGTLAEQVVTILDVALRGIGNYWNEVVIPNFEYIVIEDTLGKYGSEAHVLTELPPNVQKFVDNTNEYP